MPIIPGSNLLATALTVICPDEFQYFKYAGTTTNAIGNDVVTFDNPVTLPGSIQAVSSKVYQELGLDLKRKYLKVYVETDVTDLFRSNSEDQIEFNNQRWQIVDSDDWHPIDGWDRFLAVRVESP